MNSRTTESFRKALAGLPASIRNRRRRATGSLYATLCHPPLRFKSVHPSEPIYSARIGRGYRALGIMDDDTVVWYWIGSHSEYDRLIARR